MMFAQLYLQYEAAWSLERNFEERELVMTDTELVNVVARVLVKENGDGGIVR